MKAVILNISAWMLLPFMDGLAKFLSQDIHFLQVVWGRYFFMAFLVSLLLLFFLKNILVFQKVYKYKSFEVSFYFFLQYFFSMQFQLFLWQKH